MLQIRSFCALGQLIRFGLLAGGLVWGLTYSPAVRAQAVWAWAQALPPGARVQWAATDAGGDTYVIAQYAGSLFYDGFTASTQGGTDLLVARLDRQGHCRWLVSGGTVGPDELGGAVLDQAGNCYLSVTKMHRQFVVTAGGATDTLRTTGLGARTGLLWSLNSAGHTRFLRQLGDADDTFAHSLTLDAAQLHLYAGGTFSAAITLDGLALRPRGQQDGWLARFDTTGTAHWVVPFGGAGAEEVAQVCAADGGVYLVGSKQFSFLTQLGGLTLPIGPYGAVVGFVDSVGTARWAKQLSEFQFHRAWLGRCGGLLWVAGAVRSDWEQRFDDGFVLPAAGTGTSTDAAALFALDRLTGHRHGVWRLAGTDSASWLRPTGLLADGGGLYLTAHAAGQVAAGRPAPLTLGQPRYGVFRLGAAAQVIDWLGSEPLMGAFGGELLLPYRGAGGQLCVAGTYADFLQLGPFALGDPQPAGVVGSFLAGIGNLTGIPTVATNPSESFTLAPNPTSGAALTILRWPTALPAPGQLTLLDALGRVLARQLLPDGRTTAAVPMTELRPGLYIIRLQVGAQVWQQRLAVD